MENNAELKEQIVKLLGDLRPYLQNDGGDIELVEISDDLTISVKLLGACGTCPTSIVTLKAGVEGYIKSKIPEIKEVISV
ncbi:MAG: NifU family protein [Ichthyobacteriaceae bacterium]|nr:NifU family protein [Ichthyobacteriaceae bacterium]